MSTTMRDEAVLAWLAARPEQYKPRILDRLILQADGCHQWSLSFQTSGYGQVWIPAPARHDALVHRVVYLHDHGSIAAGMQIDHMCSNRKCANPEHLRELTQQANIQAAYYVRDVCPAGHDLVDSNLSPAHLKQGRRTCLICQHERERSREEAISDAATRLGLTWREYIKIHGRGERTARRILEG